MTCNFVHQNFPILCDVFKDPDNQLDKVILVVCVPCGAVNVTIDLNEDGVTAVIRYNWPDTMYVMNDLFKRRLSTKEITVHHSMISCIKSTLENVRTRIDAAPEGSILVTLPIKVQTSTESWNKWGEKRENGTQVLLATFTGFIKSYSKKIADSTVTFYT